MATHTPIARTAIWYLGLMALSRGSSLLLLPLAAAAFSPEEFGLIALAAALTNVGAVLLGCGMGAVISRLVLAGDPHGEVRPLARYLYLFNLSTVSILVVVLAAAHIELFGLSSGLLVAALLEGLLLAFLTDHVGPINRARADVHGLAWMVGASVITSVCLRLLSIYLDLGVSGWIAAGVVARSAEVTIGLLRLRRTHEWLPRRQVGWAPSVRTRLKEAGLLIPFAAASWGLNVGDRLILASLTTVAAVGRYAVAYQVALLLGLVYHEAQASLMRVYAVAYTQRDRVRKVLSVQLAVLGSAAAVFILVCLAVLPRVLPADYDGVQRLVPTLIVAQFAYGLSLVPANLLTLAANNGGRLWQTTVGALAVNLVLDIALIPPFGAFGAAVGAVAAFATATVIGVMLERRVPLSLLSSAKGVATSWHWLGCGCLAGVPLLGLVNPVALGRTTALCALLSAVFFTIGGALVWRRP